MQAPLNHFHTVLYKELARLPVLMRLVTAVSFQGDYDLLYRAQMHACFAIT
jgi:hypothetical protein